MYMHSHRCYSGYTILSMALFCPFENKSVRSGPYFDLLSSLSQSKSRSEWWRNHSWVKLVWMGVEVSLAWDNAEHQLIVHVLIQKNRLQEKPAAVFCWLLVELLNLVLFPAWASLDSYFRLVFRVHIYPTKNTAVGIFCHQSVLLNHSHLCCGHAECKTGFACFKIIKLHCV